LLAGFADNNICIENKFFLLGKNVVTIPIENQKLAGYAILGVDSYLGKGKVLNVPIEATYRNIQLRDRPESFGCV
jgi:hypothetical protein